MVVCLIGLTCMDIMSFVEKYPLEDSDQRCTRQKWERGGNASNNATVISCLGAQCEFFGTLANDHMMGMLTADMKSYGIKCDNCPVSDTAQSPVSVVISSEETGSRTIIHNNGSLRNLTLEDFQNRIDLSKYSWMHFEGRNESVSLEMIKLINKYNDEHPKNQNLSDSEFVPSYKLKAIPVSVEVEKVREALTELIPVADIIFVGKDFAGMKGAKTFIEAVKIISQEAKSGTLVICAWGDQGAAFATVVENKPVEVKTIPAFPCEKIIDSLGAGDTFFGAVIFALSSGLDIESTVRFACRLASAKLSHYGFRNVGALAKDMPEYQQIKMTTCSSKS